MQLPHILEELAYDMGELPREAIESAIAKKELITPHLLEILKDATTCIDEIIEHDNYQGHLYSMYLLAQFREQKAFPLILQLSAFPGDIPHSILGDVLTEDLSRILASVWTGDLKSLFEIIENSQINEYVRAATQTTLVTLVGCGLLSRPVVLTYFSELLEHKLEKTPSFVWDNLISCCCDLYPENLYDPISAAFERGFVNQAFISLEDVGTILTEKRDDHLYRLFERAELIEDTVTEMEKWLSSTL